MTDASKFPISLFDRPIPPGMHVDPQGLVESWLMHAEDWLRDWGTPATQKLDYLFNGIECLGKLSRCRRELIDAVDGAEILARLRQICGTAIDRDRFLQVLAFPSFDGWLEQADEIWQSEMETLESARMLLEDLDAADLLLWFGAQRFPDLEGTDPWIAFDDRLYRCHHWRKQHEELFGIAEPFIRAISKTFDEPALEEEATGLLWQSTVKYLSLLDACDRFWQDLSVPDSLEFILAQPPMGSWKLDYYVPRLADIAGAERPFSPSTKPFRWQSPDGQFRAWLFLPRTMSPGTPMILELFFGMGREFVEPAEPLLGQHVQLGLATGTIESSPTTQQGPAILAKLLFHEICRGERPAIELRVDQVAWRSI